MYKEIIDFARKNGLSPKKNRKRSTIAAYIKLDTNGEYKGISALDKKERPSVLVPNFGSYAATSRQANAIIEKMGYIFNIDENKYGEKHKSFLADITSGSDQCGSLSAIYNFLSRYEQDGIFHKKILEDLQNEKLNSKDFISWMIDGERVENMESDWNDWLIKKLEEMDEKSGKNLTEEKIISSFTGEVQTSVPKSGGPSINNVNRDTKIVFGLGRACFVASAKEKAYQSYGFDQAKAFQVGMDDAESLVAGLEYLLNDDNFRNKDFKLIYFYDDTAENIIGESLKGLDKEDIRDLAESEPDIISRIFDAVQKGEFPYIPEELKNVHYYMCNFNVPSTGRYLMSNECHGTYGSLVSNLYKWYKDTSLYTGTTTESITNFRSVLLNCISEKKAKNKSEAIDNEFGMVRNELLNTIYRGSQMPRILYLRALKYAAMTFIPEKRSNGTTAVPSNVKKIYVQIIKCYLRREGYQIMPELSKIDVAYACGRMFATIEQLQYKYCKYNGKTLNKNLAQSYFSGAMKHPGFIFPIISKLSILYLNNIKNGKVYISKLLGEIANEIGNVYPDTFSKEEQGSFVLGYYQQRAVFFSKKETNDTDTENEEEDK